jgi:hypothetical protein
MISRENYEIWFMNYLDGQLNPEEMEALNAFLDQNAELKKELEGLGTLNLKPREVLFSGKYELLKGEAEQMGIDQGDYLLVKQLEDGLTLEEEERLAALVSDDPALLKRAETYQSTRLQAPEVVFPRRNALLQRRIALIGWLRPVAAAAAVLLLLFTGWQWFGGRDTAPHEILTEIRSTPRSVLLPGMELNSLAELSGNLVLTKKSPLPEASLPVRGQQGSSSLPETPSNAEEVNRPLLALTPRTVEQEAFLVSAPNAYELGLSRMMPLFLELNNENDRFWADAMEPASGKAGRNLLNRGLEIVDKIAGDLVQFNKVYDDEGNYVAYNLQTPVFEMENTRSKERRRGE